MKYQFQVEDLRGFANACGFEVKEKGGEMQFKYCPYCNGGDHKDKYTFAVNLETGRFNCLRSSCGEKGHFVRMARDFNYQLHDATPILFRVYEGFLATPEAWNSDSGAVRYMESRGIPRAVTERCKITTSADKPNILLFPFFDENRIQQDTKKRNLLFQKGDKQNGSKEWFDENTKKILYGMWLWNDFSKPLIITEGQIDMLSLMSAGIENAVSVPGGVNNFSWSLHCYEWVTKFPEIIVFGDNENGKITLVDQICEQFPEMPIKVVRKVDYLHCKDANEILTSFAMNGDYTESHRLLKQCIEKAQDARKLPVVHFSDVEWYNFDLEPVIKTGFPSLDREIRGFSFGQLAILTGKSGDGKSNFAAQLIVNAIVQDKNVLLYSGELSNRRLKFQLSLMIAGSSRITDAVDINENRIYRELINREQTLKAVDAFVGNRLLFWEDTPIQEDETDVDEMERFLKSLEKVIKTNQIQIAFLDNLMTLLNVATDKDIYNAQSHFVKRLKTLAVKLNVIIVLVAHPRKTVTSKGEIRQDDISGSKNITDLCDLTIVYASHADEGKEDYPRKINIVKNRISGITLEGKKGIYVLWNPDSLRISETESGGMIDYLSSYPPSAKILNEIPTPDF